MHASTNLGQNWYSPKANACGLDFGFLDRSLCAYSLDFFGVHSDSTITEEHCLLLLFAGMSSLISSQEGMLKVAAVAALTAEACLICYRMCKSKPKSDDAVIDVERSKSTFCKVLFFPDKKIPCFKYLLTAQVSKNWYCSSFWQDQVSGSRRITAVLGATTLSLLESF